MAWEYLEDMKIDESTINRNSVSSQDDLLKGTPAQNKKVFDNLPSFLAERLNSILWAVDQKQAENKILHDGLASQVTNINTRLGTLEGTGQAAETSANTAYNKNFFTGTPSANGTANAGSSDTVARGDHIHPTDTTRASATTVSDLTSRVSALENAEAPSVEVSDETVEIYEALGMTEA